jgi:hypothetical protein
VNSVVLTLASNLLWLLAAAQQSLYSPPAPLALVAPIDPGISLTAYDIGRHPALARFFDSPGGARLLRYSVVVTNESAKHIVGVAVRWNVTNQTGQNRTATWSFDSFSTNQANPQPVIPTGTQLIATPNGLSRSVSTVGDTGGISSFGGRGQDLVRIDDLDRAQRVTAIVDTIIFEDGRVIGADGSHLVDYINAIAGAVKALVQNVRDAVSNGRDVDNLLRNIASMKRTSSLASLRADPGNSWMMREAEILLRFSVEQRMQRLNLLERVPPPPVFYR